MRYSLLAVLGLTFCLSLGLAESLSGTYWSVDESLAREKGELAVPADQLDIQPELRKSTPVRYPLTFSDRGLDTQSVFRILIDERGAPIAVTFHYTTHPEGRLEMYREIFSFRWTPGVKDGAPVPTWIKFALTGTDAGRKTATPYVVVDIDPRNPVTVSPRDVYGHAPPKDLPRLYSVRRPKYPADLAEPQTVLLRISVSSKGKVRDVKLEHSSMPSLNERTIQAARKWRFLPRQVGSRWEEAEILATVSYAYYEKVLVTHLRYIDKPAEAEPVSAE